MTRTENAGQEHQERAAALAAPTFPLGVEPDSTRALILAVEHVLGASEGR